MLASDVIGVFAGVALAIPACKDQAFRYAKAREKKKAEVGKLKRFREIVAMAWEEKRADFDTLDSLLTAVGTLGLVASFLLKLADL